MDVAFLGVWMDWELMIKLSMQQPSGDCLRSICGSLGCVAFEIRRCMDYGAVTDRKRELSATASRHLIAKGMIRY
jgi:hypothetical protein